MTAPRRGQRHRRNHGATTTDPLEPAADHLRISVQSAQDAPTDAVLRGVEGAGAAAYFGVFDALIRAPFTIGYRSRRQEESETVVAPVMSVVRRRTSPSKGR